jgi:hypothetical protein
MMVAAGITAVMAAAITAAAVVVTIKAAGINPAGDEQR